MDITNFHKISKHFDLCTNTILYHAIEKYDFENIKY